MVCACCLLFCSQSMDVLAMNVLAMNVLATNVLQMYVLGMNASYKVQQNSPFKYKIEYVRLYGVTWHFYFALHLFSMAVGAPGETQEIQN